MCVCLTATIANFPGSGCARRRVGNDLYAWTKTRDGIVNHWAGRSRLYMTRVRHAGACDNAPRPAVALERIGRLCGPR